MIPQEQVVLCLPRSAFADWKRFTSWKHAAERIQAASKNMTWLPRSEAEASEDVIQPIPCTMVLGENRSFNVFRRIANGRPDLRKRISLVVGGHIDQTENEQELLPLVESTLMREVSEELGVDVPLKAKRIGVVIDRSSILASRHIGIVHEVAIFGRATPQATEEFFAHSRYTRHSYSADELFEIRDKLDPWSKILLRDYVHPHKSFDIDQQAILSF